MGTGNLLRKIASIALLLSNPSPIQAVASPAPTPGTTAPMTIGQRILGQRILPVAREWFFRFQSGNVDRSQLDATTNEELTDAMIAHESANLKQFGRPIQFIYLGTEQVSGMTGYVFAITFEAGRVIEHIALDSDGKIAGIDFETFVPAR